MKNVFKIFVSIRRALYAMFFLMLILVGCVEASSVRVRGTGVDKESAMKDAMRVAVEQVVADKKEDSFMKMISADYSTLKLKTM